MAKKFVKLITNMLENKERMAKKIKWKWYKRLYL
jgi:hypothetical protein